MKNARSVWDALAKMTPEDRKKLLKSGKKAKNSAEKQTLRLGTVTYTSTTLKSPEGGWVWNPAWSEHE